MIGKLPSVKGSKGRLLTYMVGGVSCVILRVIRRCVLGAQLLTVLNLQHYCRSCKPHDYGSRLSAHGLRLGAHGLRVVSGTDPTRSLCPNLTPKFYVRGCGVLIGVRVWPIKIQVWFIGVGPTAVPFALHLSDGGVWLQFSAAVLGWQGGLGVSLAPREAGCL